MAGLFIDLLLIQLRVILLLSRTPSSLSDTIVLVLTLVFYSRCWGRSMFLALPIETKGISFCTF